MIKSEERRRADPQPIGNFALEQGGSCLSWTSSVAAGEIAAAAKKAPGAAETVGVVSILCPLCTQSAKNLNTTASQQQRIRQLVFFPTPTAPPTRTCRSSFKSMDLNQGEMIRL